MKILLAPLLLAISLPAFAEVDSKIHKLCIEAKDYLGCVKAQGTIKQSNTAPSGVAVLKNKEMYDKLYDFNRRQFIVKNPNLVGWVKSNPKIARESIEKEFLFFRKDDYKDSLKFYDLCKRRGKTIDQNFNWAIPCSGTKKTKTLTENNKWVYEMTLSRLKDLEKHYMAELRCKEEGKSLRKANGDNVCMSDFEYASYEERRRSREAEEAYAVHMIRQGEIDRENARRAARAEVWKGIGDSLKSAGEAWSPKSINCTSNTYGNSTFTNCR